MRSAVPALLAALLLVGASAARGEVPHPRTEQLGPGVREEVAEAKARVESLGSDTDPAAAAQAWGDLGRVYHTYGFREAAAAAYREARELAPRSFPWTYLLAVIHQERQELAEAETLLGEALEIRPGDLPTRLRLTEVKRLAGDLDGADALVRDLLEESPELAAVHALAGRIAASRQEWDRAVLRFRRALELEPAADRLHYPLGLALRQTGRPDDARRHLALAGQSEPRTPDPLVASLERRSAGAYLVAGSRELRRGNLEDAESAFRLAIEVDPDNPAGHRSLANALLRQGRDDEALQAFRRVVELSPDDPVAAADLGVALLRLHRVDEAVEQLARAAALAPEEALVRLRFAQALLAAGRNGEAIDELGAALELDPTSVEARRTRGRVLLAAGRLEEGIGELRKTLDSPAEEPAVFLHVAQAEALLGRYEAADGALAAAMDAFPTDRTVRMARARFLATVPDSALRKPELALELSRGLFEEAPNPVHAQLVAMALAASERFEEAVQWQERVVADAKASEAPPEVVAILESDLERYRRGEVAAFSF